MTNIEPAAEHERQMSSAVPIYFGQPWIDHQATVSQSGSGRKLHDKLNATFRVEGDYDRFISRYLCRFSIKVETEERFEVTARASAVGDFSISRFCTRAGKGRLERNDPAIRSDKQARYGLLIPTRGNLKVHQFSRIAECAPQMMSLVSTSEPFAYEKLGDNDTVYLFLPQKFVDQRLVGAEEFCGRTCTLESGLGRVFFESVTALQAHAHSMCEADLYNSLLIVGELAVALFTNAGAASPSGSPIRAGNFARVKRTIRQRCTDRKLSVEDIAAESGLSLRYIQELFREHALTCSDYILRERLYHARQLLERSAGEMKIAQAGFASGFSNASHFSRAFRRMFGMSPSDVLFRRG
jgi:AraC-like DNA-binding protein